MATTTVKLPNSQIDWIGGYAAMSVADVTFSSSYSAGGESVTAGNLGFPSGFKVVAVVAHPVAGLVFEYDYTNQKLKAFYPTGGATTAPSSATAAPAVTSGASTASAVNATTPALTPGIGKEVAATANLSTITVRIAAFAATVA